jgi:flagellin-like protein
MTRYISHNKKAMSPLIATILLIAFAVALGTMIISWSSNLGEASGPDCSKIMMILNPSICYADNMIKLGIRNTGADVEALTMKVVDDTGLTEKSLSDSKLVTSQAFSRDLPFAKTGKASVALVVSVKVGEETIPCPKPALEVKELQNC